MKTKTLPIVDSLIFAFDAFKRSWLLFILGFGIYVPLALAYKAIVHPLENEFKILGQMKDSVELSSAINFSGLFKDFRLYTFIGLGILIIILLGIIMNASLKLYDNDLNLRNVMPRFSVLARYIGAFFLVQFIILTGTIFFVPFLHDFALFFPGMFISLFLSFTTFDVLYRSSSVADAIKMSMELVKPVFFQLLGFYILFSVPRIAISRVLDQSLALYALNALFSLFFIVSLSYLYINLLDQDQEVYEF